MPTLTDIQQGYMDILETLALGCDEDTEAAALSMLDELGAMESDKVDAIGAVLRKYDADEKHLRDESQRLQRAAQSMARARDRFRAYLLRVMKQNGNQRLKGKATTLYISNRQSVHISVPAEHLPADYVEHVVAITPLKANIAAALKEGKDVPGALLVEQQTLGMM